MATTIHELALAVCSRPLSIDTLVEWGLARPSELFSWLDGARSRGEVAEDPGAGPGCFRLTGEARARSLKEAGFEEFRALARHAPLVPEMLRVAREAASGRGTRMAAALHKAVFEVVPPEEFPGGPEGFVAAVVESVHLYRSMYGVVGGVLDRAVALATARGDLASQALLLAASGLAVLRGFVPGDARALLDRAREASEAVGGRVRVEVLVYLAVSTVLGGRPRAGVAAFEALLGDVPTDLLAPENHPLLDPDSATPAAGLCIFAIAYSDSGQHPRALDLLHRLLDLGERLGRPTMVAEARCILALMHVSRGEIDLARPHAEAAFAHFGSAEAEPLYAWFSGLSLASVRAAEGRFEEASAAFAAGYRGWQRAGQPPWGGSTAYNLFEALEAAGQPPLPGLDVLAEAERVAALPLPQGSGAAHRFLASRMARPAEDESALAAAAARYEKAIGLLREAGAVHDLARACSEAADLAERRGRLAEAQRLRAEAIRVSPARALPDARQDAARLRSAVLGLGRLPLGAKGEGTWGEIAAKLCEGLGAERCALLDLTGEPRLLAVRGGSPEWRAGVLARARAAAPTSPVVEGEPGRGQLVLVPFAAADLNRQGLLALENAHAAPAVGYRDRDLLEALGVQLGVLFGNLTLWQELTRARERLEQENRYFRETAPVTAPGSRLVTHSAAMREVMGLVARAAPSNVAILVNGETGVGKELIAHEIHRQSPRRSGPFIAVHIASLAPGLVASGLFGHERGAFTGATEQAKGRFELADGGTLLLDEVGELSLEDQVKLLRVLQEGTFERVGGSRPLRSDFRLVAATNRDLKAEVRAGRFREDLYFRLSTFPIRVPPLRERREEIPTLALYFMERVSRQRGVRFEGIGEADMERLAAWDWPGNVRELEHVIERAALLSEPPRLRIPPLEGGLDRPVALAPPPPPAKREWVSLAEAERRYIKDVLGHTGGRITGQGGAAEVLGLKPSTLNFRIRKLGLLDELNQARARQRSAS